MNIHPKFRGAAAGMPGEIARASVSDVRTLIALTNDPALQKALEDLAGDAAVSIVVVADMRALGDELMQVGSACALLDAAAVDAPIDAAVDAITSQFPDLCLMVAGHGAEQNMLATRISNQSVFRFVHKPASPQRLRLFLDAAARPVERPLPGKAEPTAGSKESLTRIDTVRGKSPQMVAIIGLIALIAVAAGAWVFWPRSAAGPNSAPAVAAADNNPATADLIRRAMLAFAGGRYVASDGSSSAELYREALKLDQNNTTATAGYNRAIEYGLRTAEEALVAGRLNESSALAESLRLIAPHNSRLEFLNTQISRELGRVNADASQRQALEARQTQIRAALDRMTERMRATAFIDPPTSSAVFHFRQAEAAGPGDPAVRSARESLVAAMLTAADNELVARHLPAARRLLDATASLNSGAPGLDVLRRRMEEVNSPAPTSQAVEQARVEAPPAAASVAAPAAPAAVVPAVTAPAGPVAASTLTVLRKTSPEYPERALQQLVSGWVDLEFTVNTDGSVKDVVVTGSAPGRTFDTAATKAMLRYRYAPVLRNGEAVQQRAQMRMRFTAQDAK